MAKRGCEDNEWGDSGVSASGTRALLSAVLGQAVSDLTRKENARVCWPGLKINAAKWILGVGKDNGGGISIDDVADGLGVDPERIAEAIGAEQRLEELIREKANRRSAKISARRNQGGYGAGAGSDGVGVDFESECFYA